MSSAAERHDGRHLPIGQSRLRWASKPGRPRKRRHGGRGQPDAIALLVWLYIVSAIVLLGAELNAQFYPRLPGNGTVNNKV